MCGIAGIFLRQKTADVTTRIFALSEAITHRGPDGEGFIFANSTVTVPFNRENKKFSRTDLKYIPSASSEQAFSEFQLAFAHRRLSIIDLSESGYQPMCTPDQNLWITFNGEIYNYIELKEELRSLGYRFFSESDTEIILHAYKEWGSNCVKRFNGMWSFCIYDKEKNSLFCSRDRLGVKPFYFINSKEHFAFASEQKAFVKAGLITAKYSQEAVHNYLLNGMLETTQANFFEGIEELFPGHNLVYALNNADLSIEKYYTVSLSSSADNLSEAELINEIEKRLYNAVKLRLRSDVEVGVCLSGGIDSSVIVGLMHKILGRGNYCFTSVFKNESLSEESFADLVAKHNHAKHFKVEPALELFLKELDALVYSQDVPIWDTSTYAQFKVMELAKKQKIKVVIDGQGADELFAGYHHHYVALWNGLFANGKKLEMLKEIKNSKRTIARPFVFYAKEKYKQKNNLQAKTLEGFFTNEFYSYAGVKNPAVYFDSVNEQLLHDIYTARLKAFLKCEDRCGMWHSVESRTPFSDDVELINFMFSFDGSKKIKKGISKYLLREAAQNVLPKEIYSRYDKKGFETPMKKWVTELKPLMISEIKNSGFEFIKNDRLEKTDLENTAELKLFFKLFILSRWKKVFTA